jgi:predicted SnoaL-like aldol condensation-catalyzing enzyme
VSPDFLHHNPHFKGDRESLLLGMEQNAAQFADKAYKVQRVLEDGDLVAIHSRLKPKHDMPEMSVVHIYRFENDKIVEEWDLAQIAPENSPNENGLF